jgi:hypothetical protein
MSDKYSIVILNKKLHQRVAFDCGEPALNDYLQKFAVQHATPDISQTFGYPPIRWTNVGLRVAQSNLRGLLRWLVSKLRLLRKTF